jgi:hypothetical protein
MTLNLAAAEIIKDVCLKKGIHLQGYKNLKKGMASDMAESLLDNKMKL